MKKYILPLWGMLAVSLLLNSCSEDSTGGVKDPVEKGDVISFSASADDGLNTRTSYGDVQNGKYPVYWSNGDEVQVYCPQSQGTVHDATYKINVSADNKSSIYALSGSDALKWGPADAHDFYTFYPKSAIVKYQDEVITANLEREQHVTVTESTENGGKVYSGINMNYALMAGHIQEYRSKVDKNTSITLPFTPITTALDIEIKAPKTGPGLTVSSVTVANPENQTTNRIPLSGTFNYNVSQLQSNNGQWTIKDYPNPYFYVNIVLDKPVKLASGSNDVLKLTAFLLPKVNKNLRVMVNTREAVSDGATNVQSKNITVSDDHFRKKTQVLLGNLEDKTTFSYETWMASLDDNTYLSKISMPGTHDAGTYSPGFWDKPWQTQGLDISQQLNHGVRVLDFRPSWNGTDFDIAHGFVKLDVTYDQVMNAAVTWLANHPTECIIVCLKNESDEKEFTGWQANIRKKMTSINPEYTVADFNPYMTLGDVRGKLIFISRDDYEGGWFGAKISGWPDNQSAFERTFYTSSYPGGIGLVEVSDLYKSIDLYSPEETKKKDAINAILSKAKSNNDYDTWFMTYLNVSGSLPWPNLPMKNTDVYNNYAADLIDKFSQNGSYENAGVVFCDWAGYSKRAGDRILKSVIDNNFRAIPPRKQ